MKTIEFTRNGRKSVVPVNPATPANPAAPTGLEGEIDIVRLTATIKSVVTEANAGNLTASQVETATAKAIAAALLDFKAKQDADSRTMTRQEVVSPPAVVPPVSSTPVDLKAIIEAAVKAQFDDVRREKKGVFSIEADNKTGDIELPTGTEKGNLSLSAKQLLNMLTRKDCNPDHGIDEKILRQGAEVGERVFKSLRQKGFIAAGGDYKSMTAGTAGTGKDFLQVDLASQLQTRLYLESLLVGIMGLNEIEMPSNPYDLPILKTRSKFLGGTENTAGTASDPTTGQVVMTAVKLIGQTNFSYELDEDSLLPILPIITDQFAKAAADTLESAMINGDTTATHQDTDTNLIVNSGDKQWKGFRWYALNTTGLKKDFSTGGITDGNLRSLKKALGKWGVNPKNLLLITGASGQTDAEGMSDVSSAINVGNAATLITGTLPRWRGIPLVTSAWCREDLNAVGVNDGVTTTRGSVILVNTREWLLGRRRDFTLESWRDVQKQQTALVASFRRAFVPRETPSALTAQTVSIGYNYGV